MLVPMFPAYYIFNSLLCLLLVLHIVWTWLILQIAYITIKAGQVSLTHVYYIVHFDSSGFDFDWSVFEFDKFVFDIINLALTLIDL
ncbi:ASC1-like protein 1 [Operophtera brumata]|uniref:ASC1-like protein 1 n=1 Tax=Operophtera brumata TaxID=104452 RepID=A0A0L7LCH0_OPEBR|nr:ASC1-like protein 1 [Operophtera brumata]